MHFEPRQSRALAAFLYGVAVVVAAASFWFVLSSAFELDPANRNRVLIEMRPVLFTWVVVCCAGVLFSVLSLRFATLSVTLQRGMLAASLVVAAAAGVWLEWWHSLYFLLPALVLALAYREAVHA
jgi:hypothetical protein